ncbi:unnamed protein product [Acanthoscelides obtectus]|uniref:Uncharacterized protein n=1 Tax=Acanthoscelides obtectus TaxID=200917 RepID=A0A9P0JLU9_ACAOB|nr:unnamed protein product [Acanthoscelides obtectus]CAK1634817.1 hypothetical protein AOBTE_LOCUS8908 [Acanthoscelides obtectus]
MKLLEVLGGMKCGKKEVAQKWIIKIMLFKQKRYSSELVLGDSKILNLEQLYLKSLIRFMMKYDFYKEYLQHGQNTRSAAHAKVKLQNPRHTACQSHVYCIGPKVYNDVPNSIKRLRYSTVKKELTRWIIMLSTLSNAYKYQLTQNPLCPIEPEQGRNPIQERKPKANSTIPHQSGEQPLKVTSRGRLLHVEQRQCHQPHMVWTVGEDEDEEGVQRDDPENVFQEHEGTIKAQKAFPGDLLGGSIPFHRDPVVVFADVAVCVVGSFKIQIFRKNGQKEDMNVFCTQINRRPEKDHISDTATEKRFGYDVDSIWLSSNV